ncbi:formyltransferase family protein [Photorhabdus temperata]|uniref:Formyl transferase N-terminal domain-containing protein n=1 Tax=Photorhabdus temperata J3 TaxID=1389415 RepID=U7R5E2_PHOTE|nr:formyltransferase family protein [Photorhabdus temperata]ERT14587.1 hypothetical protein O185_02770 [Photorhabdus temperata J3]
MEKYNAHVLFIGDCSFWSERAYEFIFTLFDKVSPVFWETGMPKNESVDSWRGDWIISFKSDLVLTKEILSRAKLGAINIHPSSTKYRGIGGYHYAIDNKDPYFGATCHHIDNYIDHGEIIKTITFPIIPVEKPNMLRQRTAAYCLILLYDICINIFHGEKLPTTQEKWEPKLFTKKELEIYLENKGLNNELTV